MNFLEQLVSEWYSYQGYLVRSNIKFGKREEGGYEGEIDVTAYHPKDKILVHIETSSDADSWKQRKNRFTKKFSDAKKHFKDLFPFPIEKVCRRAILGFGKPKKSVDFGDDIEITPIPDFIKEIASVLKNQHPMKHAVPENYPLLRALQFAAFYGKVSKNNEKFNRTPLV